jgi:hypothetical protein
LLLGATSDKEIVDLIDYEEGDGRIHNIHFASIRETDDKCETFHRGKNVVLFLEERVKGVQFTPSKSIDECLNLYVFPNIKGLKRKARYLAYMVKVLLLAAEKRITGMTFEIRGLSWLVSCLNTRSKCTFHMLGSEWGRLCRETSMEIKMFVKLSII